MEMDREGATRSILHFRGRVRMDFTEDFLSKKSLDWLRHVLLAACRFCV